MRPPSPEDMIYCGMVLKLGIAREEELANYTRSPDFKDMSFVQIMRARGIINDEQDKAIQAILGRMAQSDLFRKGGAGAPAAAASAAVPTELPERPAIPKTAVAPSTPTRPAEWQEAPTVIQGGGATDAPAASGVGLEGRTEIISDMMATVVTSPSSASRGAAVTTAISSLSGEMSREDLKRAQASREEHGDQLIGEQLAGYAILDKLGRGGMGDVYLAKQLSLNRYVALKVLPEGLARSGGFVSRFMREAQTLAKISFASITQIYDVGEKDGTLYFTMELVKGKTLHDLIRQNKTLPIPMAVNVIKQSCRALARVAKEGIIHRDIKPGNIMLSEEGEVKVCDFGIAASAADEEGRKEVVGTPRYIAPEVLMGQSATSLADQYSLGVAFYDMLAGLPKKSNTGGLLVDFTMGWLSDINSAVPQEVSEIVSRMTQAQPEDRFASFEELFRALEAYEIKAGLIEAPAEFLADKLVELRELGWANVKKTLVAWTGIAIAITVLAVLTNKILVRQDFKQWLGILGGVGTIAIFVAYGMILYVGLARKKILPAFGNLRMWVENHYRLALAGYFMVMVHSGNFIATRLVKSVLGKIPPLRVENWGTVPTIPFLASAALFLVIISGLVGRYIFRELHSQLALRRFGEKKQITAEERQSLTRLVIGTKIMGYWRILHYPMTVLMILLTIIHVISVMYFGSAFFGGK